MSYHLSTRPHLRLSATNASNQFNFQSSLNFSSKLSHQLRETCLWFVPNSNQNSSKYAPINDAPIRILKQGTYMKPKQCRKTRRLQGPPFVGVVVLFIIEWAASCLWGTKLSPVPTWSKYALMRATKHGTYLKSIMPSYNTGKQQYLNITKYIKGLVIVGWSLELRHACWMRLVL